MNQIEMEKIADGFDANRTGLIDLSQIMAILKGQKPRARFVPSAGPARALSDSEKIDLEVQEIFCYLIIFYIIPSHSSWLNHPLNSYTYT